jgi:hypothetical protein
MASTTPVEAERLRIARELHDIVAYSFATITCRRASRAQLVSQDPDEAAKALGAIREISGEATREFRALLGRHAQRRGPTRRAAGSTGCRRSPTTMTARACRRASRWRRHEAGRGRRPRGATASPGRR